MKGKIVAAAAAALAALVAVPLGAAAFFSEPAEVEVTASSSAPGSSLPNLLAGPEGGSGTRPTWASEAETVGAWIDIRWRSEQAIGRIVIEGADDPAERMTSALLTFPDGGSLLLTASDDGEVAVDFPERSVSSVRLTIAGAVEGAESVALRSVRFAAATAAQASSAGEVTPVVSSSAVDGGDRALIDGDIAAGDSGEQWRAAPDDPAPWVQLDFDGPREVAAAQILGPSEFDPDPAYAAAAPLHARLVFSDGSEVVVSGIAAGEDGPTTIAFAPRMASSVRLELDRTVPGAEIALREFTVSSVGQTPARWPAAGTPPIVPPDAVCDPGADPVGSAQNGGLALVCPSPGSAVGDTATVIVEAPPGATVDAAGWTWFEDQTGKGTTVSVGSTEAAASGLATLELDLSALPAGPTAIRVSIAEEIDADAVDPLYVQLVRSTGAHPVTPGFAPSGMTLQWEDDFSGGLSASADGAGATYAATKPAYWGNSEFGAAVFSDPAWGTDSLATVGDRLRIRVQPLDRPDPFAWDREHMSGILSSLHVGASGFAAQYGYYEARILGAPGPGTWPAFWMLNTESATNRASTSGEVDAVELYGHNTAGSCHALHNWVEGEDHSDIDCLRDNGFADWSMSWHTYGVRIGPGGADFYIDGELVAEKRGLSHSSEPFYFMLNLALGGGWPVDLGRTGDIADMYVDWVRVYT